MGYPHINPCVIMASYIGIILSYPTPNTPEFYLIPEEDVTCQLYECLAEQSGGFPYWCTDDGEKGEEKREEREERGEEQMYDLKNAIPYKMSPHDDELTVEPKTIIRWYGFVVQ